MSAQPSHTTARSAAHNTVIRRTAEQRSAEDNARQRTAGNTKLRLSITGTIVSKDENSGRWRGGLNGFSSKLEARTHASTSTCDAQHDSDNSTPFTHREMLLSNMA